MFQEKVSHIKHYANVSYLIATMAEGGSLPREINYGAKACAKVLIPDLKQLRALVGTNDCRNQRV